MDQVHEVVHGPRSMFCIRPTTAAGPILLRPGRATKMAVFWSYFRDFRKLRIYPNQNFFLQKYLK